MSYTNRLLSALVAMIISSVAYPCSFERLTKTYVSFFQITEEAPSRSSNTKTENLRLWQRETSQSIPLADIEEVVYGSFKAEVWGEDEVPDSIRDNKFYRWIRASKAVEIQEFLTLAKQVEKARAEKCSPWYYPAEKTNGGIDSGFATLLEQCAGHENGKLKERYWLQMIRLFHASCQYEQCVMSFNQWFGNVPDSHLMKRMAMDYVAGAWTRLGDTDKANRYFAMNGDMNSLHGVDALAYMIEVNPSASVIMQEIEEHLTCYEPGYGFGRYSDERVRDYVLPMAYRVVREGKAHNMGEWEFLVAYIEGEYNNDYNTANQYIHRALAHGLPTQTGRDHARAYKMAVDGSRGNIQPLLADLKWLEDKVTNRHWRHVMQGVVYGHWFEYLTAHNRLPMAILLSNYTDNFCACEGWWDDEDFRLLTAQEKNQMRTSRSELNEIDFNSPHVKLMMNVKPQNLIDYKNCLNDTSSLVAYLRDGGHNDDDFLNELIGTLYLHEGNYIGACNWLSKVSPNYQYTLNTFKEGYLTRDPFAFTSYSRANSKESKKHFPKLSDRATIKLTFASRMYRLEQQMKHAKDDDTKAIAAVEYALARYASFTSCWALTSYQYGYVYETGDCVYPDEMPHRWDGLEKSEEERMRNTISQALASIKSDDVAAEAQYLLGNLKTVAKKYPNTTTGKFLSTHCDNWKHWI